MPCAHTSEDVQAPVVDSQAGGGRLPATKDAGSDQDGVTGLYERSDHHSVHSFGYT